MALIRSLLVVEKEAVYKKLYEELNSKLSDLLDAGSLTPAWLDS